MSSVMKEHAADEAGGEVILSSDGLDPLPSVRPPVVKQPSTNETLGELDDTGLVSMQDALHSFVQKSFLKQETPRERLERLSQELSQVEAELQQDDALRKQVAALQLRLQGQQSLLQKSLEASTAGLEAAATPEKVAQSELEAKLLRLEKAVGEPDTNTKALLERLAQLETVMEVMDESKLDAASRKAKLLRQDLEAASKARNKLMAPNRAEDSKTLTALYDSMTELQEMSQHLPALTQRLQMLSHQHVDSATWASRLQSAEAAITRLNAQLSSVETAVSQVEGMWKDNADMLRSNLKALDERIQKLG